VQPVVFNDLVTLLVKKKDSIGNDSADIAQDHSRASNYQSDGMIVQESSNPAYEGDQHYFMCEAW
jgi:hypothetical protein